MFTGKRFWLLPPLLAAAIFVFAACESGEEATETATITPQPATGPVTPGVAQIAFTLQDFETGERSEIFLIGADRSGPVKLVEGEHNFLGPASPGGDRMIYWSDEEVPNESYLYVADRDGSNAEKVTEESVVALWCSEGSLLLEAQSGRSLAVIRYDLGSGKETTLLADVGVYSPCSPDGRQLAFVGGVDYSRRVLAGNETLELLDIDTEERHQLDGPLMDRSYGDLKWSPDGRRLGYIIGPPRETPPSTAGSDLDLYVMDVLSGQAKLVYSIQAGQFDFAFFKWSPSGRSLLVFISGGTLLSEEEQEARHEDVSQQWQLVLVNVESGEARQVVTGEKRLYATSWAPDTDEDSFTYVAGRALYLESVNGEVRELATGTEDECAFCLSSFGWSPDGRYLGLQNIGDGSDTATIAVVDTTTGEVSTLLKEEGVALWNAQWWR